MSLLPCIILEAFEFVPLLCEGGFQVQVGAIVGELQCTVVQLQDKEPDQLLLSDGVLHGSVTAHLTLPYVFLNQALFPSTDTTGRGYILA